MCACSAKDAPCSSRPGATGFRRREPSKEASRALAPSVLLHLVVACRARAAGTGARVRRNRGASRPALSARRGARPATSRRQAHAHPAGTTDARPGQTIVGASVSLESTAWRATTDDKGQYRIADVAPGTYTLTASRIGYARLSQPVTVGAGEEATVDLALRVAPTLLDQVVV